MSWAGVSTLPNQEANGPVMREKSMSATTEFLLFLSLK
jgi:hypothetical protein